MSAADFFFVFSLNAIVYAMAAGLAFGATVPLYISLRYPTRIPISTLTMSAILVIFMGIVGGLFFAGQIVQAITSDDPLWIRALARACLWGVYSLSTGLGLGIARSFAPKSHGPS